ncbi:MAG: L-seryl-tRNA(Sec) selenium transferase [Thermaerobacter sp.]|nr:L-seryl-tRNA(Sec) selenium transferase [Thermaerobacter sp.]
MASLRLRDLPALHRVLQHPEVQALLAEYPQALVHDALRAELEGLRRRLQAGEAVAAELADPSALAKSAREGLGWLSRPALRGVINATGVVVHTNLGRAPLARTAAQAAADAAARYVDLEFDLEEGRRGSRQDHLEPLLCRLTGAESALVVNNNAAAVFLVLATLARGREVVLSRGELVEIGGSFRIPDVMAESGALLREVGTTNRTHLRDYVEAVGPETAALLRVHPSNFRQIGFTARVNGDELAKAARAAGVLFLEDLGSGALLPVGDEPTVGSVLESGADLLTMSGDKLVGGPQAGIILGRRDLVERLRKAPLYRALRPDKMTVAALAETVRLYLRGEEMAVPVYAMLAAQPHALRRRAQALRRRLRGLGVDSALVPLYGRAGGGALPESPLPSYGVALAHDSPDDLHHRMRLGDPPVIGRIEEDRLVLDVRTVLAHQEDALARAVATAWAARPEEG